MSNLGVVVIGRNEGERLRRCLTSVVNQSKQVVYVDSGSDDGSVALAESMGVAVIPLDMTETFTAARARNAGVEHLLQRAETIDLVQFVDGDCEVVDGWLKAAIDYLDHYQKTAVVFGRLRERFPQESVYNQLCDIEWDTPIGDARSCGGVAMMRVRAFQGVGRFRESLIAGEEPELCVRLRRAGWKIWRLDADMALHDAAMTKFGQWWRRSIRAGHAYAEGCYLHGAPPERHGFRESMRIWLWGGLIPAITLAAILLLGPIGALLLSIYPLQVLRLGTITRKSSPIPWLRAFFLTLGKFPELIGQLRFIFSRIFEKNSKLIEYK